MAHTHIKQICLQILAVAMGPDSCHLIHGPLRGNIHLSTFNNQMQCLQKIVRWHIPAIARHSRRTRSICKTNKQTA